jgi:hypothetical protein
MEPGGLTVHGGGLTVGVCAVRELTPIALDRFSRRDPVRRSSPKSYSRSVRSPRMSQVTTRTKREQNWGLEERVRAKEIKQKCIDKFLVDVIGVDSIGHETFII